MSILTAAGVVGVTLPIPNSQARNPLDAKGKPSQAGYTHTQESSTRASPNKVPRRDAIRSHLHSDHTSVKDNVAEIFACGVITPSRAPYSRRGTRLTRVTQGLRRVDRVNTSLTTALITHLISPCRAGEPLRPGVSCIGVDDFIRPGEWSKRYESRIWVSLRGRLC